jgi:hypothetical protein
MKNHIVCHHLASRIRPEETAQSRKDFVWTDRDAHSPFKSPSQSISKSIRVDARERLPSYLRSKIRVKQHKNSSYTNQVPWRSRNDIHKRSLAMRAHSCTPTQLVLAKR